MKHMRSKRYGLIGFVALFLALVFSVAAATEDYPRVGVVLQSAVNIRAKPDAGSNQIGRLKKEERVAVLGAEEDKKGVLWYQISLDDGKKGFVRGDLIALENAVAFQETPSPSAIPAPLYAQDASAENLQEQGASQTDGMTIIAIINEQWRTGIYIGALKDGKPDGEGTFSSQDSLPALVYSGHWENGQISGAGHMDAQEFLIHFHSKDEGDFDKKGPYLGDVFNGLPEGQGKFTTQNSDGITWHYDGEWKNGLRHGQGVMKWEDKDIPTEAGDFFEDDFRPTWCDLLAYFGNAQMLTSCTFSVNDRARSFIEKYSHTLFSANYNYDPPSNLVRSQFELNQFKKNPSAYGDLFVLLPNMSVFQVFSYNRAGYDVEQIGMEDASGNVYWGFVNGKTDAVEGIMTTVYFLPFDYRTYENTNGDLVWATIGTIVGRVEAAYETLYGGCRGDAVIRLKVRLQELGYFSSGAALSDVYNDTCAQRVRQFQSANGLPETGRADDATQRVLYSGSAVRNPY